MEFSIGMSRAGEIKNLSKLINPHIGVITNIGEAHLENFKKLHGIANAKSELLESIKPGGTAVLNRDDKFFKYLSKKAKLFNLKFVVLENIKNQTFGFYVLKNKKINQEFL